MKKEYLIIGGILLAIAVWLIFGVANNQGTQKVMVYFSKSEPTEIITVGVEREIFSTPDKAIRLQRTVSKLLRGPSDAEKDQGLQSSISPDVKLNSIQFNNKTVILDFNEALDFQVGGSARVIAIREQLERTVLQFNFIDQLLLTVNNGARKAILEL